MRAWGNPPDRCEELLQGFFEHLLVKESLRRVQRKGRFRNWLLKTLRNYTVSVWRKEHSQEPVVLGPDPDKGEMDPPDPGLPPDEEYARQFAIQLLNAVMELLEQSYRSRSRQRVFDVLHEFLHERRAGPSYRELASVLGTTEQQVANEVSHLRERYRQLFREEIENLCEPAEVEDEIRALFAALSTGRAAPPIGKPPP